MSTSTPSHIARAHGVSLEPTADILRARQGYAVDHNIIQVHHHKFVKKPVEYLVHQGVEGYGSVHQAEGHDNKLESSIPRDHCHLRPITLLDSDLPAT
ncbi:UNVERIFIED_CONTAM: hypothetical protein Sradi_5245200 [Sesamum radiatum]|uniref:Uncharacterized protein n=1 Tax=Sesamum radiatum TaxID=300843 RepID=A0AAW2LM85_SESRA